MLGSWHFKGFKNVARNHASAIDYILCKARQEGYWDNIGEMQGQTPSAVRQDVSCGLLATQTF